ncbi:MAG: MmgE/PrpD family protein [Deltaproteobacteria bacterium]|nr:MAG: MmgE/PrpD family protein [Deltaproteobacteria bacterium]
MNDAIQEISGATREFCARMASVRFAELPGRAIDEGKRGVLDWLGCALAGSRHPTLDHLLAVLQEAGGKSQATVFGRGLKLGFLDAPIANGQAGHVLDYDDTHMGGTLLHASSPTLAALFALAERELMTGAEFLLAYAVGFEAGVRTGQSAPGHHKGGWHLTGTLGSIAAGVAAGKLLGLDGKRLAHAMAIAATQSAGMQQNRGTMCKSFHAGKAASSGVLAALLAERGFDGSLEIIEGKRGYCRIYSDVAAPQALTDELGSRWEITRNGHKPYACGVVLHPVIDAMIAIRSQANIDCARVEAIDVRVHPLVISITGVEEPATGLQSKFSVYHSAAVALIDGAARIPQYTDERASDPAVIAMRRKVKATADKSLGIDQAEAVITVDGSRHRTFIEHATGTVANPMSEMALDAKFMANAEPVIGRDRAQRVRDLVRGLDRLADVRELIGLCA